MKKERKPRKAKKYQVSKNERRWRNELMKQSKRLGYFIMTFDDTASYLEYYQDGYSPKEAVYEDWSCM